MEETILTVNDLDPVLLQSLEVQPHGKRKRSKGNYLKEPCCFDIETTNIDSYQQSIMYIWQFQLTAEITVIGRTWNEFRQLVRMINKSLAEDSVMVVYVHNLSFEFQFIKSIIPVDSVFAMNTRRILKMESGKLEFRCSYIHSNMSLRKFLQTMGVRDQKTELDYSVKRYPWTALSEEEIRYCINDVKGLREALLVEMQRDSDDLYTIPLTSTGYVRREAKGALKGYGGYIHNMLPDLEIFRMLRAAFRGGNTHANRWNADRIIRASPGYEIYSYDISSSYPSVLLSEKYPCRFTEADPDMLELFIRHEKACLMDICLFDVKLKNDLWPVPYIALAKCAQADDPQVDNGRILSASALRMTITEVDLDIIQEEYSFSGIQVNKLYVAKKRQLPIRFRRLLMEMYREKTELKGTDDYLYTKTKNKFNSFYGMTVQNPVRPELIFKDGILQEDETVPVSDLIAEYQKTGWLPYQWGVWCTAYARRKLEDGIRIIDPEAFLYTDTDSVKFVGNYDEEFRQLNDRYLHHELSARDLKGNLHYIGIFEKDNDKPITAFVTMGAKKYAYTDADGLHLTVSGVAKKEGAAELGCLENFKEGFIFRKAGGQESIYNDVPPVRNVRIQQHDLEITSNIYLYDSTYTLSIGTEYRRLINFLNNIDIKRYLYDDYS